MRVSGFGRILPGFLAAALAFLAAEPAAADSRGVSVDGVWCRVSDSRAHTGFVYLTLTVRGEPTDTLVGASTPLASTAKMVGPVSVHGRPRFNTIEAIELDAHAPTVLQPQGPHFLLKGLRHKLLPGQSFVMTLIFAKAGRHDITVHVRQSAPADGMPKLPKGVKLN
jgi:periplasmic copper chaperone A